MGPSSPPSCGTPSSPSDLLVLVSVLLEPSSSTRRVSSSACPNSPPPPPPPLSSPRASSSNSLARANLDYRKDSCTATPCLTPRSENFTASVLRKRKMKSKQQLQQQLQSPNRSVLLSAPPF